ncbi:Na+/Ca+ antiporter, CaCA family [Stanieria cyanosphaera PCC 7437]|uniref:Na+/Ca+ antiporter, CaCA family n=1 Tax=Stanieria cyanosphaera (strain ATCC 29371 / PCC 7437) TaxID=111780 RepID=K9XZI7_STAC7|nr:calcium/sodium antiporter [Stanieria cyanosphaera]AFZ37459.1 Na+/Ca+ antiporter, CaCA family [Stanieria cyanosphaera PCC 7437]
MTLITFLILFGGLVLLVIGAELLVKGASNLAGILGIPPLIIGLTIVAYGTSSPEMAVSVMSSWAGQADLAVGNVVGSNIFNVLLILGLSALVTPLIVTRQLIRSDVPIMIGVSILLLMFGLDGKISRVDGIIFFVGGVIYTLSLVYQSRQPNNNSEQDEFTREYGYTGERSRIIWFKDLVFIVGGLGLLVLGSRWLVDSATTIARALGVSDLLIGLTIVSAGTSLPELATSVIASLRGERDIAVGNVLGSNIFNILAVLGLAGIVAPNGLNVSESIIEFDVPVAIAVAFACLPIFYSGNQINRWEGLLFVFYYLAYVGYLILNAINHDSLPVYTTIMLFFVIPLTVITLVAAMLQERQARRKKKMDRHL